MPQATAIVRPILSRGYGNTQSRFILLVPPLPFRSNAALLARNTLMHTCRRKEAAAGRSTPNACCACHHEPRHPVPPAWAACTSHFAGCAGTQDARTFVRDTLPAGEKQREGTRLNTYPAPSLLFKKIFANRTGVTPCIALHGYGSFSPSAQRPRLAQGQATPFSWSFPSRCRACPVK